MKRILIQAACALILLISNASAQQSWMKCNVGVLDLETGKVVKEISFAPVIQEEELTNKTFRIPGTRLFVTASVFSTDESMASQHGYDSVRLGLAVSGKAWPQAFASPNNTVAEVTLNIFDTARVETKLYANRRRLFVRMECWDRQLEESKEREGQ